MAIAARQGTVRQDPSWDETIVPTLRKRLESESRTLAKRMSAVSMISEEPGTPPPPMTTTEPTSRSQSTLPRSSLSKSRAADTPSHQTPTPVQRPTPRTTPSSSTSTPKNYHRARTRSQPPFLDQKVLPNGNGRAKTSRNGIGTSSKLNGGTVSQPSTPAALPVSRIPKVAHPRSGSTPSSSDHTNDRLPTSPIRTEVPPFPPTPTSPSEPFIDYTANMDTASDESESEERPFEHWYRGEVSRNGGVGELRVGKRVEMLEIASYGHAQANETIKNKSSNVAKVAVAFGTGRRKRAGSWDRDSFYMDRERARELAERVMDESPLTDLEDGSLETHESQYYTQAWLRGTTNGIVAPGEASREGRGTPVPPRPPSWVEDDPLLTQLPQSDTRSTTPTGIREPPTQYSRSATPTSTSVINGGTGTGLRSAMRSGSSKIPAPARQSSEPAQKRAGSEPPSLPSSSAGGTATKQRRPSQGSTSQPRMGATTPTSASPPSTRRRGGSVNGISGSASKKAKTVPKKTLKTVGSKEKNRMSVAEYPAPQGEELEDAIPTWTQPVGAGGNWDDVVLPVVARKKGLDGQYETAGGSPSLTKQTQEVVAPQPGMFGIDHSKFRPPRGARETIPMDEFGQRRHTASGEGMEDADAGADVDVRRESLIRDERPIRPWRSSSPPFSQYAPGMVANGTPPAQQPQQQPLKRVEEETDDKGAGCCKCVIM